MPPKPVIHLLQDYRPADFTIDQVDLTLSLYQECAEVTAVLACRRREPGGKEPLLLDGEELELLSVRLDGVPLAAGEFLTTASTLTIPVVPDHFSLETRTRIFPQKNTALEGLYRSGPMFCTQCEAEGFRKITYFLDRPDIMALYTVTIEADRTRYPILLANGNPAGSGQSADSNLKATSNDNRHWARWIDPFPKPSYLFALVAGDLAVQEEHFITASGREIILQIYVEHHNRDRCGHAMTALKKAMAWDEAVYGLECDLDRYMIVAVDDFNMGAMENKGLNIFNSKYVLADPLTATDDDFAGIETVVAHEYFHNWTGNRVTCRDWFQLSLKEGLTVFRDQEFTADQVTGAVKRIRDVEALRNRQFLEDAGPLAHPVRPESYMEINNFYTVTVYEKGAEVIRMLHALLGPAAFRRGMDLYFSRHDGQAVTCEDFVKAMEDATPVDLSQFRLWYSQAGTPTVTVRSSYDREAKIYTLEVRQQLAPTPGQPVKAPMHIPLRLGLLDSAGNDMILRLAGEDAALARPCRIIELKEEAARFSFVAVPEQPVPSLFRGFSAPVKVDYPYSDGELLFLLAKDGDPFNRWEAGQKLALGIMQRMIAAPGQDGGHDAFVMALRSRMPAQGQMPDASFLAQLLTLPTEEYLSEQMAVIDVDAIHQAHLTLRREIAAGLRDELLATYHQIAHDGPYRYDMHSAGRRRLKNLCLAYLMTLAGPSPRALPGVRDTSSAQSVEEEITALCQAQYDQADNMTDSLAALRLLVHHGAASRDEGLRRFAEKWRNNQLVMDKWFAIQATSPREESLTTVCALLGHPEFSLRNPNRVRALIGSFCGANQVRFHEASGAGYRFLTDQVLAIDPLNHQIAARLLGNLSRWRRFDPSRQERMRAQLVRIQETGNLSRDVFEVLDKCLA